MLSKFETKSNRVKGLCFHPKRPWILASLHNGSVQLWDYKMGTLIDRFDEHEGPVRGIHFHPNQPLFVSGGDDYKVKVWNWRTRRCLFTLNGHLDYIRTVFFHHENPWIISASDDQTIRIWNWQSRTCISILTGHNHYVMCAQFHHKDGLVVSASLDQTVRVWDITGLMKKHSSPASAQQYDDSPKAGQQADIFGNTDCVVKYVLEGHDRGVNWAAFHPTTPMIISAADDRQIKLWRMNQFKAWEVGTCRGHYNNVSCAIFHPRAELLLSNAEDKTVRIWDLTSRAPLQTFRREHDRFWILTAHPEVNLFAAGHDSGLIVFKLERERPASTNHQTSLYYVREKTLYYYNYESQKHVGLIQFRRPHPVHVPPPKSISYNPADNTFIFFSPTDGGIYEMFRGGSTEPDSNSSDATPFRKGAADAAVFIARNRYATLSKANARVNIYGTGKVGETTEALIRSINLPPGTTAIDLHNAGPSHFILTCSTSVLLYDSDVDTPIAEVNASGVRYVLWNANMTMVAFMSKHSIMIANKKLEQLCTIHETIKIKSGAWDDSGILIYSTLNHLKYALPEGDNGIIRTLPLPLYITYVRGDRVAFLDRDAKVQTLAFDATEYRFKLALIRKKYDEVLNIIRRSNLVGQAIIAYLQKKGYPEVALHFVKDPKTRFELALECGNLEAALETAKAMDKDECWDKLATESLKQGNHQIVEMAYQRIKNFDRLSFLYLATGNGDKLKKMMKIAELRGDSMSRYHNALYLGDIEEQLKVFKEAGQGPLAYLMAKTHGLTDEANAILAAHNIPADQAPPIFPNAELLKAPTPLLKQFDQNWPHLTVARGFFEAALIGGGPPGAPAPLAGLGLDDGLLEDAGGDWGADDMDIPELDGGEAKARAAAPSKADGADLNGTEEEGGGWEMDDDLLLDDGAPLGGDALDEPAAEFVPVAPGAPMSAQWSGRARYAAEHAAAGNFEQAMALLSQQAGIVDFGPLKPTFLQLYAATQSYLTLNTGLPALGFPIHRAPGDDGPGNKLPYVATTLNSCIAKLQEGYASTTTGKFSDALATFTSVLHALLLIIVSKRSEAQERQQMVDICREYILGLAMETKRKEVNIETPEGMQRAAELAAYFTHCQLQSGHLQLSLRSAMTISYKMKNFASALNFARRLLELGPAPQIGQAARKVQQLCERTPTDAIKLNYDQFNPFKVCGISYTPIYRGSASVECGFCHTTYQPAHDGKLCTVCGVAEIGAKTTGFPDVKA